MSEDRGPVPVLRMVVDLFRRVVGWTTLIRVILAFQTKALRVACEDTAAAGRQLGSLVAARLTRRLADLDAAERISDLVAGNPRLEKKDGEELLTIDVDGEVRLYLRESHNPARLMSNGQVDWDRVTRLKVVSIG